MLSRLVVAAVGVFIAQGCHAKMPGVAVVTALGAKGDGVTDDTGAIQAAELAVEARPGCGTVEFPPGNYVINSGPVVITKGGCRWHGSGGISFNESSPFSGVALVTDKVGQDIVFANAGSSLNTQGPAFENLNFIARYPNIRTQKLLHVYNFNLGHIHHCSFRNGLAGVYFEGPADDSNWVIDGGFVFYNNVVGIDHAVSKTGGGNNVIANGYINVNNAGDIGIRWQSNNAQGRVYGIHFDSRDPPPANTAGISTLSNHIVIAFNDFENFAPAVVVPDPLTPNDGRGTQIISNGVRGNCSKRGPAWSISPHLQRPVVISLNTYACVNGTIDGR